MYVDQGRIDAIISGDMTQIRYIVKPNETIGYDGYVQDIHEVYTRCLQKLKTQDAPVETYRLKWMVGRNYAVSPGRGKPGVWWNPNINSWKFPESWFNDHGDRYVIGSGYSKEQGWRPLRIVITDICQERLQDISEENAVAEGCQCGAWHVFGIGMYFGEGSRLGSMLGSARDEYAELWDSINTRKGTRWIDNPLVWVLTFRVLDSVACSDDSLRPPSAQVPRADVTPSE